MDYQLIIQFLSRHLITSRLLSFRCKLDFRPINLISFAETIENQIPQNIFKGIPESKRNNRLIAFFKQN